MITSVRSRAIGRSKKIQTKKKKSPHHPLSIPLWTLSPLIFSTRALDPQILCDPGDHPQPPVDRTRPWRPPATPHRPNASPRTPTTIGDHPRPTATLIHLVIWTWTWNTSLAVRKSTTHGSG
ncbi:hypothetical protein QJS10_CPA10g00251 [Acorus calamus]|uniref:Uncharacterized protein n=1 Tax=Acorus calamus TaxID=4465 RepID=A0AAV9E0E3_ACOCL|nr:hypothetical protein QJS10_CPB22g00854 [Acorus calamus]KAK1305708.1 hypothetical protein QJS10_CPA10g00251 [Acorus calamus]